MTKALSKAEYEEQVAGSRDERMEWWRAARFGMFVHYGLYSQLGRQEWAMALENYPVDEYEKLADTFHPRPDAPREWAELARKAGMRYMVLTTRHHEGFSLWDSEVNPYNAVNCGGGVDVVKEFVDACREHDLKVGFYSSLMDWHHPDGWKCAFDSEARARFTGYIYEMNRELVSKYGRIDIMWYDVPAPMESWEGWNSLELNQMVREHQPHIIINNRCKLEEDYATPEERILAEDRDWEACMTFNDISWGYVDSKQAAAYSYNAQRIIRMLNEVTAGSGNLLLNIGPAPDGSVPEETTEPLCTVGKWIEANREAVYGRKAKTPPAKVNINGICDFTWDGGKNIYLWNWIWPAGGRMTLGGFMTTLKKVSMLQDGTDVDFVQKGHRILLENLPGTSPDKIAGVAVMKLEFDEVPVFRRASYYPQLHGGRNYKPQS